jgi:flavin-dependent dehydrogenase
MGTAVKGLVRDKERVAGVVLDDGEGAEVSGGGGKKEVRAALVVGADGRHAKVAEMAGLTGKTAPNNRFFYFGYYENLPLVTGERALIWFMDPDVVYCFPNDDGLTLAAVMPHKDRLPAFKSDLEKSFRAMYDGLPRAPDFSKAKRLGDLFGMLELPNCIRPTSGPGIALIGDAAMTSDPIFGVGCGWALQSAEWLVEDVADALKTHSPTLIDEALETYRKHHHDRLAAHHDLINEISQAKPFNALQRLLFAASARDDRVARDFGGLVARLRHPKDVMTPGFLARAVWAARPSWLGGQRDAATQ